MAWGCGCKVSFGGLKQKQCTKKKLISILTLFYSTRIRILPLSFGLWFRLNAQESYKNVKFFVIPRPIDLIHVLLLVTLIISVEQIRLLQVTFRLKIQQILLLMMVLPLLKRLMVTALIVILIIPPRKLQNHLLWLSTTSIYSVLSL